MNFDWDKHGIDAARILYPALYEPVRRRFLTSMDAAPEGLIPDICEVRWAEDFQFVFVLTASGLIEVGFDLGEPAVFCTKNYRIYSRRNRAAAALLDAVKATLAEENTHGR